MGYGKQKRKGSNATGRKEVSNMFIYHVWFLNGQEKYYYTVEEFGALSSERIDRFELISLDDN